MAVRLFHSIWSKPQNQQRWGYEKNLRTYADILCAATSVAFAKRNRCTIVLHTDKAGRDRYGWLPYDEIYLSLENHPYDVAFWASGKVIAQAYEPLGSISIDPDVFIKTDRTVSELEELKFYDIITQNEEFGYEVGPNMNSWSGVVRLLGANNLADLPEFDIRICNAYCCGLVGFNNQRLKDLYVRGYNILYNKLMGLTEFQRTRFEFCPDLIIEQAWLNCCTTALNARVKNLLEDRHQERAVEIAYTHVINVTKYQPETIVKIEELLYQVNKSLYNQVMEIKPQYING
jgi:hypothetical protein